MGVRLILPFLLSGVNGQITRSCPLQKKAVENIFVENVSSGLCNRNLRGRPMGYNKAFVKVSDADVSFQRLMETTSEANAEDENQSSVIPGSITPFQGYFCDCTQRLPTASNFYCPVSSTTCEVWRSLHNDDDYTVSCTNDDWKISYSRYMWYYLIFWFAFLTLSLLFTAPGQHAIKYVLSRRIPSINTRITDLILEIENNRRIQSQENIAYHRHLQRSRDGWISGYRLKTKRYIRDQGSSENNKDEHDVSDIKESFTEGETTNESNGDEANELPQDACSINDEQMCTICLLEIENGDLVADVKCGHVYHANCLSEWILKKNSCPLCQAPDIAEAVRSFDTEADFTRSTSSSDNYPDTAHGRLRRYAAMSAVGYGYRLYGFGERHQLDSRDQRAVFAPGPFF